LGGARGIDAFLVEDFILAQASVVVDQLKTVLVVLPETEVSLCWSDPFGFALCK
jgi:hypothetical protein